MIPDESLFKEVSRKEYFTFIISAASSQEIVSESTCVMQSIDKDGKLFTYAVYQRQKIAGTSIVPKYFVAPWMFS